MPKKGVFIVLEGPDKAGKSTQARLLARALKQRGFHLLHTREPGGTPLAEEIRRIILKPGKKVSPLAELMLYEASRAQHVQEKILPALKEGKVVLCERFTLATLAYQGFGRGLPLAAIRTLNRIATGGIVPHLTIVLDVPEARFESRMKGKRRDRLEEEGGIFQARVREGYRLLAKSEKGVVWVDADRDRLSIHEDILKSVLKLLRRKGFENDN